jgi:hypothetical protein
MPFNGLCPREPSCIEVKSRLSLPAGLPSIYLPVAHRGYLKVRLGLEKHAPI